MNTKIYSLFTSEEEREEIFRIIRLLTQDATLFEANSYIKTVMHTAIFRDFSFFFPQHSLFRIVRIERDDGKEYTVKRVFGNKVFVSGIVPSYQSYSLLLSCEYDMNALYSAFSVVLPDIRAVLLKYENTKKIQLENTGIASKKMEDLAVSFEKTYGDDGDAQKMRDASIRAILLKSPFRVLFSSAFYVV